MSNVSEFSTTASSNNSAAPNGFPEGMSPASLNDSAREVMAALAKWYKDTQGTVTTAGTTTAYTLTTNNAHAALNDIPLFAFQVNATNTGAATLNVDSLGAKSMNLNGAALEAGDIVANEIVLAVYNPDNDVFDLFKSGLSQSTIKTDTINELTSANGVVIDSVTLKDGGITATGTVVAPTVDIDAGAIDGTTIGANSAAAGTFTTLTTSSNVSVTGNISVSGTVDGRDIATDGSKLDNIEANADVTDATNVNAAGAVMNSDTSTASMSFVIDEDAMGSNLDTKVPTQQSVKAYVDATVVAIGALSVAGTPVADDYARFTGAATIEGRSLAELKSDLDFDIDASVSLGLTAGTTQTQVGATAMTASINEFSIVANANDGGALPSDTGIGERVMVVNNGAEDLKVWPASGDSINDGATDAADTAVIASGAYRIYTRQTATNWNYEVASTPAIEWLEGSDLSTDSFYEIDFTGYTGYDEIRITGRNIKLNTDGGVIVSFSESISSWSAEPASAQSMLADNTTASGYRQAASTTINIAGNQTVEGQAVKSQYNFNMSVLSPHDSSAFEFTNFEFKSWFWNSSGNRITVTGGGALDDEPAIEGIRIGVVTAASLASGRIDVYGVKNS